jgi:hypothetical protein
VQNAGFVSQCGCSQTLFVIHYIGHDYTKAYRANYDIDTSMRCAMIVCSKVLLGLMGLKVKDLPGSLFLKQTEPMKMS